MSVQKYKGRLFESILDLLWKQWTALGIPGHGKVHVSEVILDPEALLLFSAGFARYDQRLYDLILDWLTVHSAQINIQHLKALRARAEWQDAASLGYMCAVIAETDPARWRKAAGDCFCKAAGEPAALFRDRNNKPEPFIPEKDPLALRCGFLRNVRRDSGKIPGRLPENAAALLLKMRGLLGISARAETILILSGASACKVQEIADRSGFTWKSIQDVLEELISGGFVSSVDGGRGKRYFLTDPEGMKRFFGIRETPFLNWMNIYDAMGELWQVCSNPLLEKVSEETFRNELRILYRERLRPKLLAPECGDLGKTDLDPEVFPDLIRRIYG